MTSNYGTLYVVATPIGNLSDISLRAVETLKSVSLIAAEDTRTTKNLLTRYDIHTPLTSYHEHNESAKAAELICTLLDGLDVALVSDAGTPTISDPGFRLIEAAVKEGVRLTPIPGPSAVAAALSVSGLPTDRFLFVGFLPDKKGKRQKKLEELKDERATIIIYISKWKIKKVVDDIISELGDRRCCFCRELTKMHEEIRHVKLSELLVFYSDREAKGEITLVVEGKRE